MYAVEQRRVPGRAEPVTCVLLDSVQSQANRMEQALQDALDAGTLKLPLIVVDFSKTNLPEPVGRLTSLQLPHRFADAILRDSEHGGKRFRESDAAKGLNAATLLNATPLYELCPTALVFGAWDSTGPKGGLGTKFERAMVSEVVGVGASINESHKNRGIRRDPLEARSSVPLIRNEDKTWTVSTDPKQKGTIRPSEVNHGSVPFDNDNAGVTIDYAEQTTTLSLICFRRLRFPVAKPVPSQIAANTAAQTVLAALGLYAATAAYESGLGLRSRCLLWPEGPMTWELLAKPGEAPEVFSLTSAESLTLLKKAVSAAKAAGVTWREEELVLTPNAELVKLVVLSQEQAKSVSGEAEAE